MINKVIMYNYVHVRTGGPRQPDHKITYPGKSTYM